MTKAEKWDRLMAAFPWGDENADISGADVVQEILLIGTEPPMSLTDGQRERALERFSLGDDLEIGQGAEVHPAGDDGIWISAWLYQETPYPEDD